MDTSHIITKAVNELVDSYSFDSFSAANKTDKENEK